jgi:hypothetical protein
VAHSIATEAREHHDRQPRARGITDFGLAIATDAVRKATSRRLHMAPEQLA